MLNLWGCYDIYMNVERGLPTEYAFANQAEIKSVVRLTFYEMQVCDLEMLRFMK